MSYRNVVIRTLFSSMLCIIQSASKEGHRYFSQNKICVWGASFYSPCKNRINVDSAGIIYIDSSSLSFKKWFCHEHSCPLISGLILHEKEESNHNKILFIGQEYLQRYTIVMDWVVFLVITTNKILPKITSPTSCSWNLFSPWRYKPN